MDETRKPADLSAQAFEAHREHVYRFLLRHTGSPERAEELCQQVFADATVALRRFRPGSTPVLALLYTLARRRFADAARQYVRIEAGARPLDEFVDTLAADEHDELLAAALREALARLPADLRVVTTMKLVQGCSFAEISRRVGASEPACRKRLQRGLELLRELLSEEGYGGRE